MSLINATQCKAYALELGGMRAHKFNRVSKEFTDALEGNLKTVIRNWVHQNPSVGKTLYPPVRPVKIEET